MKNKSYRFLSIILSILVLVGACVCPAVATAQETSTEINYYVMNGGTGDGSAQDKPAATVKALVDSIKDKYDADDTVNVIILQRSDWNTYNGEKIGKISGAGTTQPHKMTVWTDSSNDKMTAHTFKMVVKSPEGTSNYLAYGPNLGENVGITLGGPTVFDNVTLVAVRNTLDAPISFDGKNVEFTENCKFGYVDNSYSDSTAKVWDCTIKMGSPSLPIQLANNRGDFEDNDGLTITLNAKYNSSTGIANKARALRISTARIYGTPTIYNADVNIIIDNEESNVPIIWGSSSSSAKSVSTFNKNLNINIKSAASITNSEGGGTVVFGDGAALQIIIDSDTTYTGDVSTFSKVTLSKTNGVNNYWYLTNATDDSEIISFTTTAGTFNVKRGYDVVATDESGNTYPGDIDNPLVLPAGKYTITATKKVYNYYVMSTGYDNTNTAGNGKSETTPAATVADVIATIKADGLAAGDVANIYIMQDSDGYNKFDNTAAATYTDSKSNKYYKHNMTSWTENGGSVPEHDFTVVVKSYGTQTNYLTFGSYVGLSGIEMVLGGPTVFENVILTAVRDWGDTPVRANGNSLTLGEATQFATIRVDGASASSNWNGKVSTYHVGVEISNTKDAIYKETVNMTFNNKYSYTTGYAWKNGLSLASYDARTGVTFKEDVNITFDNADATWSIALGGRSGSSATYEKNVNIDVKSAKAFAINSYGPDKSSKTGAMTVNGALQLMYPSSATLKNRTSSGEEDLTAADLVKYIEDKGIEKYYVIENKLTEKDVLTFTETAGIYKVKSGLSIVAVDEDGKETYPVDGTLTLTTAGKYTVQDASGPKMLYFKVKDPGPLQQRVTVEPGATYTYTFSISENTLFTKIITELRELFTLCKTRLT